MNQIKKFIFLYLILLVICLNIFTAVPLEENEFYKKALELFNQAKIEFEKGEYDKGYELSEQTKEELIKANEYNMIQILLMRIQASREIADKNINKLFEIGADNNKNVSETFNKAVSSFDQGETAYKDGNEQKAYQDKVNSYQKAIDSYNESIAYSNQILNELSVDKDYLTAKELLEKATVMKEQLINDQIIIKNDNDDKEITKIIDLGKDAFDNKKYTESINKSEEAIALMDKINKDRESSNLVLMNKALELLSKARNELKNSKENIDEKKYEDKLKEADIAIEDAKKFYDESKYQNSIEKSQFVIDLLNTFDYGIIFPRYYKVQLITNKRDCLWRIAEKDFVYSDGEKWTVLYRVNKNRLKFPENPNLIFPWKIIEIPSLNGEKRKGLYNPNKKYPKFDPKRDYSKE